MNTFEWQTLEHRPGPASVHIEGVELRAGDHVRLNPRPGADVLDIALAGKTATIEAIEHDYDDRIHVAVVLDADPGRDLGLTRMPGHRFYFDATEVTPLLSPGWRTSSVGLARTILVAGIGNIFFGDDAFGVEVAQRLLRRTLPPEVHVVDFGIRGFDLACAIGVSDVTILVDAYPHGAAPGAITVIEPDAGSFDAIPQALEPHRLDPLSVLRFARALHPLPARVLLIGCEPLTLGGEDGVMGLSEPVRDAVDGAVALIESLTADLLNATDSH